MMQRIEASRCMGMCFYVCAASYLWVRDRVHDGVPKSVECERVASHRGQRDQEHEKEATHKEEIYKAV